MPGFALLSIRTAFVTGLMLVASSGGPLAAERVGINSAVNPEATGTPPGAAARRLVIGQDVLFNEHITTTATGQTQLLFLDASAMTVGPNSDLTIDQFVYDPKTGTGKQAMSATRGLLRYVGGKLSKQNEAVTLRTSTATLAVRGGAFFVKIDRDGTTQAVFLYGKELIINGAAGGSQTLTRPGFESTTKPGGTPSEPAPQPPGQLAQFTQALSGTGSGGATTKPTDAIIAGSGLPQTISGDLPQSLRQAEAASGTADTGTIEGTGGNTCATCAIIGNTIQSSTAPAQSSTAPAPPPQVTITYAGRLKNTNGNGTARGFVDQSANGDAAYAGGILSFPAGAPQQGVFTASAGALGTVSFPLVPGSASFQGTSSAFGNITGTSFLNAENTFFYASITPTSQPAQRLFIFGGTPVSATALQPTGSTRIFAFSVRPDAALQSNIPFIRSQAGGNLANASTSPLYVVAPPTTPIGDATTNSAARALQASLAVSGQGANQQSAIVVTAGTIDTQSNGQPIVNGALRGSSLLSAGGTPVSLGSAASSTVDGAGNSLYGGNAISGFVLNQTSPASETTLTGSTATYGFAQPVLPQAVPSGVGTSRTSQALAGNFGGLMHTSVQTTPYIVTGGAFVVTDAPDNRVQANFLGSVQSPASGGINTLTMQYGGLTGTGSQAFVDNDTFAAIENPVASPRSQGYFASSGAAGTPTSLLPSEASNCSCQYLQWGYWGGDLLASDSTNSSISRIDRGHINTWVAGVATPLNDLSTLMSQGVTGIYSGAATGSVYNNGASYLAAGGFAGTYNFGTQTGTFAINNFDGRSFASSGSAPLAGANYSASVTAPGVRGSINGTFYGPMAAETGGNFSVQSTVGPAYLASGVFAGKR
jgi:trimeric autotransporter adhesin